MGLTRRRFLAATAVVGTGALVQACAPGAVTPSASVGPSASSKAVTKVKLFGLQALTGPSSPTNLHGQAGAELAVKQINDAGGFEDDGGNRYSLELSRNDMGNDRTEAISLARQAGNDSSVLAIIGPTVSLGFLAAVPLVEGLRIPIIGCGTVASVPEWNTWSYRVNPVVPVATPSVMSKLVGILKVKRVGLLYDQTAEATKGAADALKKEASNLGYSIVADQAAKAGDQDYSAQVSVIKNSAPDFVLVAGQPGDGGRMLFQLRGVGVDVPVLTVTGDATDPNWWDISKGTALGVYGWVGRDLSLKTEAMTRFLAQYPDVYPGKTPTDTSAYGYDAVSAVVAAIKKARTGTDREKVRAALSSLDLNTPVGGHVTFKNPPTGENLTPTFAVFKLTGRGTFDIVP